ncbi:glycoside hydrolase family 1 protein [Bauldia sp.]|uniref:glycoside hydrolase family 1 protein n=1 Tax=Bauldia sp. TaxID=2575872 RepID=UPI003BAAEA87
MNHQNTTRPFLWGAASAAYQVEGGWRADGRGLSKWDVFTNGERITEKVVGAHHTGNVAINTYDPVQYRNDIALMRDLGLNAYRFSLSWPRILPDGTGAVNTAGLDYYRRFVDDLLAAGIAPIATLYHWDFPAGLFDRGGWHNRDSIDWFRDYAAVVFEALGDRVDTFVTLNEPFIDLFLMDLIAENARSGEREPFAFTSEQYGRQAPGMHNLLLANAAAVGEFRRQGLSGMVGIALPLYPMIPIDGEDAGDIAAAAQLDGVINRWPLDAVLKGTVPDDVVATLGAHNPAFAIPEADRALIAANSVDFIGVNYYAPMFVETDESGPLGMAAGANPDEVKAFNGPVRPEALHGLLLRLRDDYGNPPVIITENGAGFGDIDEVHDGDAIHDPLRTDYLRRHIDAVLKAKAEGADVRGYLVWSLFDNFEWIQGYTRRFGMVHVDFETQTRTPKDSYAFYRDLIAAQP